VFHQGIPGKEIRQTLMNRLAAVQNFPAQVDSAV
jgi:hypothetical protein